MTLTEDERRFASTEKVSVYVEPYFRFDASSGGVIQDGFRVLILRGADILARGTGSTRLHAFALAKARYELTQRRT